jgi:hypothetical protein
MYFKVIISSHIFKIFHRLSTIGIIHIFDDNRWRILYTRASSVPPTSLVAQLKTDNQRKPSSSRDDHVEEDELGRLEQMRPLASDEM